MEPPNGASVPKRLISDMMTADIFVPVGPKDFKILDKLPWFLKICRYPRPNFPFAGNEKSLLD
jgi:hypothetical protein